MKLQVLISKKRYYILVGDSATWKVSMRHSLWGFTEKSKGSWNTTNIGDYLAFYVTAPTKKIIGFGKVKRKFVDETNKIWLDEKYFFKKAIWKYRIEIETLYVVKRWSNGIDLPSQIIVNTGRKVVNDHVFLQMIRVAESKWKQDLIGLFTK